MHRVAILRAGVVVDHTATVNVRLLEREQGVEAGVYGGEKSIQLLLDDVRVGDTLWITYTTEGENPVFGKRWAQDFSWDRDTPVELRRLTMLHPPHQRIYWRQLADVKAEAIVPVIDRVGDVERMRFEGRAIDAVQFEPSVPAGLIPFRRLLSVNTPTGMKWPAGPTACFRRSRVARSRQLAAPSARKPASLPRRARRCTGCRTRFATSAC